MHTRQVRRTCGLEPAGGIRVRVRVSATGKGRYKGIRRGRIRGRGGIVSLCTQVSKVQ